MRLLVRFVIALAVVGSVGVAIRHFTSDRGGDDPRAAASVTTPTPSPTLAAPSALETALAKLATEVADTSADVAALVPSPGPSPTADRTRATRSADATGTLVDFSVIASDALVIRFTDIDMASCVFNVHTGPQSGADHADTGIVVDYQILPVASWRDEVAKLAQPCSEHWIAID